MKKEIARKVADHLRKFPGHEFPKAQEDDWELGVFDAPLPLTDEEGELLSQLTPYMEHIDDLAKRLGRGKNELLPLLDGLIKKLWVLWEGPSREDGRYQAHTSPVEFYMPYMTPDNMFDLMGYFSPDPPEGDTSKPLPYGHGDDEVFPYLRVVPRESALPHDCEILPGESISYMINHAGEEGLAVAECICRKGKQLMGGSCDHDGPIEQCLFLPPFAKAAVDAGVARSITKAEAFEIIERARKHGLVHEAYSATHPKTICSCCPDCCSPMQALRAGVYTPNTPMHSNFYSVVNPDLCQGALDCIPRCPVEAIRYDDETSSAVIDDTKCLGCGICVETCPYGAFELKRREKTYTLPHTEEDFLEIDARQKKKAHHFKRKMHK
jgi:Na+-translocating ferredoxin:NAD+ oxidoreductase subunit B